MNAGNASVTEHLSKKSYKASQFVNRTAELDLIKEKVTQGRLQLGIREPLVNFWGVSGIGKTWLLLEIQRLHKYQTGDLPDSEKAICAIYYDFGQEGAASLPGVSKSLARSILNELQGKLLSDDDREKLTAVTQSGEADELVKATLSLSEKCTPLFLFDTTENLDKEFWVQLEEAMLEDLLESNQVIIVIAGRRRAPRWKRVEVRRRAVPSARSRMLPFDETAVKEQLEALELPDAAYLAQTLFTFTGGAPLLVHHLGHNLPQRINGRPHKALDLEKFKPKLIEVLQNYRGSILKDVPADLRKELITLSVLRFYRTEALRFMLSADPVRGEIGDVELLRTLRRLDKKTEVVWWDNDKNGYVTAPVVRQVLSWQLRLADPGTFQARHKRAGDLYWSWVEKYPENSAVYLAEICFHQASIDQAQDPPPDKLTNFDKILTSAGNLEFDKRMILPEKIMEDRELQELLPPNLFKDIVKQLDDLLAGEVALNHGGGENE